MSFSLPPIVFVGGGNMASAIASGLLRQGAPAADITVIEPQTQSGIKIKLLKLYQTK